MSPTPGGSTQPPAPPSTATIAPEPSGTWMPTTAGVLSIIAGVLSFFTGLIVGTILGAIGSIAGLPMVGA